jgi:hypothetical protein
MSTVAPKHATTPIPVQLSETEFTANWERRLGAESRACSVCAVARGMSRSCLQM